MDPYIERKSNLGYAVESKVYTDTLAKYGFIAQAVSESSPQSNFIARNYWVLIDNRNGKVIQTSNLQSQKVLGIQFSADGSYYLVKSISESVVSNNYHLQVYPTPGYMLEFVKNINEKHHE